MPSKVTKGRFGGRTAAQSRLRSVSERFDSLRSLAIERGQF
jgi:hypothetical protein